MAPTQFAEHRQRALKHQNGAVVRQPSNTRHERHRRWRVQIERMVGAVAGDHRHIHADVRGTLDCSAEAAIRLGQVARPVVQVGEVRDPQRRARGHGASRSAAATLSA
jgi:hypothetical protein